MLTKISDIIKEFENEVDLIIDNGNTGEAKPSTLISLSNGKCKIIRQGDVIIPESLIC